MDQAIEHFKVILKTAILSETTPLLTEITALKERVALLTSGLNEKDRQCRHLMDLLHSKNTEWKRIKSELMQRRSTNSDSVVKTATAQTDISVVIDDDRDDKDKDKYKDENEEKEDSTQLPAKLTDLPPRNSQTQSNLDALVSLISETESEPDPQLSPAPKYDLVTSFAEYDGGKKKRKSHARGCACCEKYYSATRSGTDSNNFVAADSFIVSPKTPPGFWDTSFTPKQ